MTENLRCNEITESQWMEICGLLTLGREFVKKSLDIESIVNKKYPFLEGYFSDETYDDMSLNAIRNKWLSNELINMKIKEDESK